MIRWIPERERHHLFLTWLLFAGVAAFALLVAWREGGLALLYDGDRSRISWVITVLFLAVCAHAAWRTWYLSCEINAAMLVRRILLSGPPAAVRMQEGRALVNGDAALPECLLTEYLRDHLPSHAEGAARDKTASGDGAELTHLLRHRLQNPHEIGWFLSDVMIKLGLLGTIVGFVLMLGSVLNVTDFDPQTMQGVLKNMSSGMGTALYTTFAGLVCSILTSAQYYLLDQGAEQIMESARHLSQTRILPALRGA